MRPGAVPSSGTKTRWSLTLRLKERAFAISSLRDVTRTNSMHGFEKRIVSALTPETERKSMPERKKRLIKTS